MLRNASLPTTPETTLSISGFAASRSGVGSQNEVVGDPRGHHVAHPIVAQRVGRPVRELVGVEQGAVRVAGEHREEEREGREPDQDARADHVPQTLRRR